MFVKEVVDYGFSKIMEDCPFWERSQKQIRCPIFVPVVEIADVKKRLAEDVMHNVDVVVRLVESHFNEVASHRSDTECEAHAPLPARASVDQGVGVVVTGKHRN